VCVDEFLDQCGCGFGYLLANRPQLFPGADDGGPKACDFGIDVFRGHMSGYYPNRSVLEPMCLADDDVIARGYADAGAGGRHSPSPNRLLISATRASIAGSSSAPSIDKTT
jgi:hypothetical protein